MIYRLDMVKTCTAPWKGDIILMSGDNQLYAYKANNHPHCYECCFNGVDGCSLPKGWGHISCKYASFSKVPIESIMEELI